MALQKASKIWMNGKWVGWDDAKIHILSHVVHYASSVFEGIRCYATPRGPAIFRVGTRSTRIRQGRRQFSGRGRSPAGSASFRLARCTP